MKVPTTPADVAPASKGAAAKDAKKGPLTPAEREMEYRKNQAEAEKAAAKADQEKKDIAAKQDNCERAREMLRALESGQRLQRTDANGERYYVDDAQREQDTVRARLVEKQSCN